MLMSLAKRRRLSDSIYATTKTEISDKVSVFEANEIIVVCESRGENSRF